MENGHQLCQRLIQKLGEEATIVKVSGTNVKALTTCVKGIVSVHKQ